MKLTNPFVARVVEHPAEEESSPADDTPDRLDDIELPEEPLQRWYKDRLYWWNTIAFLVNTIITYGVGSLGWLGKGINNAELSAKYQVSRAMKKVPDEGNAGHM